MLPHVLGNEYPFLGVCFLVPVLVVAEIILIHLSQIVAVDAVAATNRTGGHRTVV